MSAEKDKRKGSYASRNAHSFYSPLLRLIVARSKWQKYGLMHKQPRDTQMHQKVAGSPLSQVINQSKQTTATPGARNAVLPNRGGVPTPEARILVTGGAGFIGCNLIALLNALGVTRIMVTDDLHNDEKWKNLPPLAFDDFIQAATFLSKIQEKPDTFGHFDAVFHLGACSATTETDADYILKSNYEYTKALCLWSLAMNSRFVYASSAATYGDGSLGMSDSGIRLSDLRPLNPYGYSKQLFDLWAERRGLLPRIVGLKYFNVFGPGEHHKGDMRSVVCKAYEQVVQHGVIKLFKSYHPDYPHGEQMRDFVYVKDAVMMTLHLAMTPNASGLYNIGTGQPQTWLDLANAIFHALDREPNIEFIEMPENLRAHYQYYTAADVTRLYKTGYPYSPTPLEDAVADYVLNYLVPGLRPGDVGIEINREDLQPNPPPPIPNPFAESAPSQ